MVQFPIFETIIWTLEELIEMNLQNMMSSRIPKAKMLPALRETLFFIILKVDV